MAVITEIADIFTQQMGYIDKLQRLLEVLARTGETESVSLRKPDQLERYLRSVASWGPQQIEGDLDLTGPSPSLIAVESYRRSEAIVVSENPDASISPNVWMPAVLRSAFVMPIKAEEKVLGILSFSSSRPGHFTESRVRLLTMVGNCIGVLVQNAQLQEDREVEENIGSIVSSGLEMDEVYERFASEVGKIIDFDRIGVYTVGGNEGRIHVQFLQGQEVPRSLTEAGWSSKGSVLGESLETGEPVLVHHDDPEVLGGKFESIAPMVELGYRSFMAIPLKSSDRCVGVLGLSTRSTRYTEVDLARATRIGNLLAGAVESFELRATQSQIQAELADSEERLRQIAENINGVFWLTELGPRRLIYISPGYEKVLGRPPDEIFDDLSKFHSYVHPDDRARFESAVSRERLTGSFNEEYRIVRPDGSIRWVRSRGFQIRDASGKLYRAGGISEDITEQKETEARMAEAERLAAIGELSAGMAHEINNPLAVVVLYSEIVLGEDLPEAVRQDIEVVRSSAHRAATIVRNLLLFSRRSTPVKQLRHMDQLVERCLETLADELRSDGIEIVNDIPENLPPVLVDEHQIAEVLLNILSNARQACASADGHGRITLSAQYTEDVLRIKIQDNGPGIPQDIQQRIFEPFFTTKDVGSGTGLGLSLSFGIMAKHDGGILVESEEGRGATFILEFPVSAGQGETEAGPTESHPLEKPASTGRILVVEDEVNLRNIIVRQLTLRNFTVDAAANGLEAMRKLQSMAYDCILLDVKMPDMDGRKTYEHLLERHSGLASRVVFMTGDAIDPDTQEFLDNLSNPILEKPFDTRDLCEQVAQMVDGPV